VGEICEVFQLVLVFFFQKIKKKCHVRRVVRSCAFSFRWWRITSHLNL
jgi:hypothetical protein